MFVVHKGLGFILTEKPKSCQRVEETKTEVRIRMKRVVVGVSSELAKS